MRFLLGLVAGIVLTLVAVYFLDRNAQDTQKHVINWDVLGEQAGTLTKDAQKAWADFTREITGPQ
ncbi:hypothetical protein [Methyloceanibacter sp.]|uniref:hypothetical protein n=1 Tax=Methyloceanibacter sp. TaxID=1965321 RepID=UPI002C869F97|nr:hypothetical protein [Methyloceanibacter sp.]HML92127.1 hypothetical protein [Methyloceanibacter sp.]